MNARAIIPVMFPLIPEYEAMMIRTRRLERANSSQQCTVPEYINLSMTGRPNFFMSRPFVRAARLINGNSTTDIIDVSTLSRENTPANIQYSVIEIIDINGRLHCLNESIRPSCWLKIITLATDFQNCNVLLMSSNRGIVLKTTRDIAPGEPLLMWFADCILTMLNIPFLTPMNCNTQGQVYTCHNCNSCFDSPNPLKLHLALDCNRMDNSYIWTLLASKIVDSPRNDLSFSEYPGRSFAFELNSLPVARPTALPISVPSYPTQRTAHANRSSRNDSPCSSNQQSSPSSNNPPSPIPAYPLPTEILPSSSTYESPVDSLMDRRLALRPYAALMRRELYRDRVTTPYDVRANARTDLKGMDPADLETRASGIGKCTEGYKCLFCNKIYSRKYGLRIHIRTHTGYKPLKCNFCAHRFGDPSNLNKHVRLHVTEGSRYKCDICDKVLVRRRDLERHINSWHSEKSDGNTSNIEINDGD